MTRRGAMTRTMACTAAMVVGVAASLSAQDTTQTRDTTRATRDTAQATAQQRIPVQKRESFGDVNLRRDTSAARDTAAITDPFRRDTTAVPRDTMMRDTTMRDTTMRDTSAFRTDTTVRDTSLLQRDTSLIQRDTSAMMQRDTSFMRDTSLMRDTTVQDTSAIRDTSAVRRDTSLFQRDTSFMRDTSAMQRDTSLIQRDTSTIFRTDTSAMQRDTSIFQRDTLARTDTLMRTDTAMTDTTMTDTAAVRTDTSLVQLDTVAGGEVAQQGLRQPRYLLGGTGWYVGFSAGASPTVGDLEDLGYNGGLAISVPIGWHRPTSPFGVRLDLGYNRFNGDNFTFTNGGVPVTIGNPDPEVWSAVLNATLGFPLTASGTTRLYLVGGGGLYHFRDFGRGSSLSGFLGNDVLDPNDEDFESSLSKFGVNGGAGLEWSIGAWGLFLESRFVNVFADRGDDLQFDQFFGDRSDHVRWVPITLGVTIR